MGESTGASSRQDCPHEGSCEPILAARDPGEQPAFRARQRDCSSSPRSYEGKSCYDTGPAYLFHSDQ